MIYFISDTHFNHTNIIKYCNRPFKDVYEMNEVLIDNWNKTINEDDEIFHLGDLALGGKANFKDIARNLNGKKYLIRGNHDNWSVDTYESVGFTVLKNPPIKLSNYKLVLSHVPAQDNQMPEGFVNVHGHIHDKSLYECIEKYDPQQFSIKKHINIFCDVTNFKPISIEALKEKYDFELQK